MDLGKAMARFPDAREMKIEFVVHWRYPGASIDMFAKIKHFDPEKAAEVAVKAAQLREELALLSEEELDRLHSEAKAERDRHIAAQAEKEEAARPFNQAEAMADFAHWARMDYWTIDEGLALLLGRSPSALAWDRVKNIESPLIRQFAEMREAASRAVHWKTLSAGNRPAAFILWAKRLDYPVPPELEEQVKKFGHFMGDWYENYKTLETTYDQLKAQYESNTAKTKAMYEEIIAKWKKQCDALSEASAKRHSEAMELLEKRRVQVTSLSEEIGNLRSQLEATLQDKPTGQREADTLRKLVIGLAMGGYGYDPTATRSDAVSAIVSDLAERGLTVSDDTVRKHLRQSAELLPPPEAPERRR